VPGSAVVTNVSESSLYSFFLGYPPSPQNRLIITNGGALFVNGASFISYGGTGSSAYSSSNTVLVTGAGSLWSTTHATPSSARLSVELRSSFDTIWVENGGMVRATYVSVRESTATG